MNKWPSKSKDPPRWRKRFDAQKSETTVADELLKLVSQGRAENVDLIKRHLDRLWRQSMNGGTLNNEAIKAAQKFIRDVESSRKGQK